MNKKEMICISCPIGCHLDVKWDNEENIKVSGNKCPRGEYFAIEEILSPKRIVTASVKIHSKLRQYISVKTNKPVLKKDIDDLLREIYSLEISTPIKVGEKIIENFNNTNIDVLVTSNLYE